MCYKSLKKIPHVTSSIELTNQIFFCSSSKGMKNAEVLVSLLPSVCQCLVEWKTLLRLWLSELSWEGDFPLVSGLCERERQGPHTPPRNIYLSSWLDGLNDCPAERREGEKEGQSLSGRWGDGEFLSLEFFFSLCENVPRSAGGRCLPWNT